MCHFCILYSEELNRYYFDHTCDTLEERLRAHPYGYLGFTGKAKDGEVACHEVNYTKASAYARERQVKGWKSRKLLESLVGAISSFGTGHPKILWGE